MMPTDSFESDVKQAFADISHRFGMKFKLQSPGCVIISSDKLEIIVRYDYTRSFEVAIELKALALKEPPFNLGELFRFLEVPNAESRWFLQTEDYGRVQAFICESAETLGKASDLLNGKEPAWAGLLALRRDEAEKYTQSIAFRSNRPLADIAWQNKDYCLYVELLSDYKQFLPQAEKAKLQFAKTKGLVEQLLQIGRKEGMDGSSLLTDGAKRCQASRNCVTR